MSPVAALVRRLVAALGALLLGLAGIGPLRAQEVLPVPPLSGRVIDQTATLSEAQRSALDAKLAALERDTGSQVVVLLVPTTQPEDIAAYAQRVADSWKIGRRTVGDGVLIVSAQGDRKLRIEVAKTLEGAIPDLAAKRIISEQIAPAFKAGDFAGGLQQGVDRIAERIRAEALPGPQTGARDAAPRGGLDWEALAMVFFIGVPIVGALLTGLFGRKLGALLTGGAAGGIGWVATTSVLLAGLAGVLALLLVGVLGIGAARGGRRGGAAGVPIIWGGGGGGGWSGGGGGGGFSSGGGGDFGGGGASGDW